MKILVTGGLGYIGSHVIVLLLEQNIEVLCIDNLDNSRLEVLDGIKKITKRKPLFKNLDLKNKSEMDVFFKEHSNIQGIIHAIRLVDKFLFIALTIETKDKKYKIFAFKVQV